MTTAIKILCITASFTLFTLSTVGLEIEDTFLEHDDSYQEPCTEELVTQVEAKVELETNP